MKLDAHPLTPEHWPDLEAVFNARGCSVARGCWCMHYRRSRPLHERPPGKTRAQAERADFKKLVDEGTSPGLIGYRDGAPVGWISLGPRGEYARLAHSPTMRAVDDVPVWSIVCFVVPSAYRGQGVARALLDAGIAYARSRGARVLEAYPVDKPVISKSDATWFGLKSMFDGAGFEEVARRVPHRPIVRKRL